MSGTSVDLCQRKGVAQACYVYQEQGAAQACNSEKQPEAAAYSQIQEGIDELSCLATQFFIKYPWQNIRALRIFYSGDVGGEAMAKKLENTKLPKELLPEITELYEAIRVKHQELIAFVASEAGSLSCLSFPQQKELEALISSNFLEIILWAYERSNPGPRIVNYRVAKGAGEHGFWSEIDPRQIALIKALKLFKGPSLSLKTVSTASIQEDLDKDRLIAKALSVYPSKPENKKGHIYNYYLDVYGVVDSIKLPALDEFEHRLSSRVPETVKMPHKIWLGDWFVSTADASGKSAKLDLFYADRYVDLREHRRIFQFLKQHENTYLQAAAILAEQHPAINPINLQTLLYANTFVEMFWMNLEDPWQDNSAADSYNAPNKSAYKQVFDQYLASGATFGYRYKGKIYNLPWSLATKYKVPVESQAFGVNQVVIGTMLEAGADTHRWERYFPGRKPELKTALSIALDPDGSVFAMAMIYDFYLSKLKQTSLQDAGMAYPSDVYPMFQDSSQGYEFNLLNVTRFFDAFAEASKNFPNYFPFAHYSWNLDFTADYFVLIQRALGLGDGWPSLQMNFIPSAGVEKHDWLAVQERWDNEPSLLMFLSPKHSCGEGLATY